MTVDRRLKMMAHAMNEERTKNFLDREGLDASPAAVAEWKAAFRNIEDYEFRPAGKGKGHSHMALMLEMGPLVAKSLAERSWQLGQDIRGSLVTSDHPVLGFSNPTPYESLIGLGTENAEWFIFPLSPKDVLILSASSRRETRVVLDDATTGRYNEMIAGFGYQYVFQHPESPRIDNLIPAEPRQIASGEDLEASILRVGSTDDLLRELYGS